jgi:ubiquinone/menaquinone biosynthesis C-methylase UbiE
MQEAYANLADRVTAVVSEGTILEVGPGPAFVSIEIARRIPQARIVGLDISETMIGIGRRNVAEAGLSERITFRLGNAVAMPFDGAEFDFVVSSGSLHHWSKPIEVFEEIYRVLKPSQAALVYDVRKDAPKDKVDEFSRHIGSWFMRWGLRHSVGESYTQQGIEQLLSRTRFKKAERIELDDLGMFIWLRRPANPPG